MAIGSAARLQGVLQDAVGRDEVDAAAAADLWSLRRPALRIVAGAQVGPRSPGCRLGGRPLAAPGAARPVDDGDPLDLLVQLDLAAVARVQPGLPLPDHGVLSFFYDTADPPWQHLEPDPTRWRVRWESGDLAPASGPDLPASPSYPARAARLEAAVSLPDGSDDFVDLIVDVDQTETMAGTRQARCVLDDLITAGRPVGHQLLGWPHLVQGSMVWGCQQESDVHRHRRAHGEHAARPAAEDWDRLEAALRVADWRLLLQLGTDREMGWDWGGGALYFLLPAADLAAGRFERTWTVVQTS